MNILKRTKLSLSYWKLPYNLFHCVRYNNTLGLEQCITRGDDINERFDDEFTPLYIAAWYGHIDIVDKLIEAGANLESADFDYKTPVYIAAERGHSEILEKLILAGARAKGSNSNSTTTLYIAARNGHANVVKFLLRQHVVMHFTTSEIYYVFEIATEFDQLNVIKEFLNSNTVDINQAMNKGLGPLHIAANKGRHEIAFFLIKAGANVNLTTFEGFTPLYYAISEGHADIVKLLLYAGADINHTASNKMPFLHLAADNGSDKIVKELIAQGVNIDLTSRVGRTALYHAVVNGYVNVCATLIAEGADVNLAEYSCVRPIVGALVYGHKKVAKLLLQNGATYNFDDARYQPYDIVRFVYKSDTRKIISRNNEIVPKINKIIAKILLKENNLEDYINLANDLNILFDDLEKYNFSSQTTLYKELHNAQYYLNAQLLWNDLLLKIENRAQVNKSEVFTNISSELRNISSNCKFRHSLDEFKEELSFYQATYWLEDSTINDSTENSLEANIETLLALQAINDSSYEPRQFTEEVLLRFMKQQLLKLQSQLNKEQIQSTKHALLFSKCHKAVQNVAPINIGSVEQSDILQITEPFKLNP